jgi:HNH endonuclease
MNSGRKPVHLITDRAKRYRANSSENRPPGRKQCGYCGSLRNVGVDHVNGREDDGDRSNLMWACKSCNGKKAAVMRKKGLGKLTRQYNPARGRSSRGDQMKAYGDAIKVMRGQFDGDVAAAVATIKATPAAVRSAYTSRSLPTRKALYGSSGRSDGGAVPF